MKNLKLGDLFLLKSTEEVISFSICLFTGEHNYQRLTQTEFADDQEALWTNIGRMVSNKLKIEYSELKTIIIEVIHDEGDSKMLEILSSAREKTLDNVEFIGNIGDQISLEKLHTLFTSEDEVNRDMASNMLIGALNDAFASDSVQQG